MEETKRYLDSVSEILKKLSLVTIEQIMELIYKTYVGDRFIFLLGNAGEAGGSRQVKEL